RRDRRSRGRAPLDRGADGDGEGGSHGDGRRRQDEERQEETESQDWNAVRRPRSGGFEGALDESGGGRAQGRVGREKELEKGVRPQGGGDRPRPAAPERSAEAEPPEEYRQDDGHRLERGSDGLAEGARPGHLVHQAGG